IAPTRRNTTDGFIDKTCPSCGSVFAGTAVKTCTVLCTVSQNVITHVNPTVLYFDAIIYSPSNTFTASVDQVITNGQPDWVSMTLQNSYFVAYCTPSCVRVSHQTLTDGIL